MTVLPDIAEADFGLSDVDLLAAGFPCTDISHAGAKAGIGGPQSGLVSHVFRVMAALNPTWVLLENVPNLLALHGGAGMRYLVDHFVKLGYRWAYRVVDTRFTGLPQRRNRVLMLASRHFDPAPALLGEDAGPPDMPPQPTAGGFYWTEGRHGVGLVPGAIPTLKGGSTIGLPSAPAVWFPAAEPGRRFVLPDVEDGEALQGLPRGWTRTAVTSGQPNPRWKLVGNAVPPDVGTWIARRITNAETAEQVVIGGEPFDTALTRRWPTAAFGCDRQATAAPVTPWPHRTRPKPLSEFISPFAAALSHRATTGFLRRLDASALRVPHEFYADLEDHQGSTRPALPYTPARATPETHVGPAPVRDRRTCSPELTLRRHLHARGLRYRLQYRPLRDSRRRFEIVFIGARVAVDVRRCRQGCPHHGDPVTEVLTEARVRTARRDAVTLQLLADNGWTVIVVWEHQDPAAAAQTILDLVTTRRRRPARRDTAAMAAGVSATARWTP